jgi:hypothetical protein
MRFARFLACVAVAAACGKQAPHPALAIAPARAMLPPGGVQLFTAPGTGAVAWSLAEPGAGVIASDGTYTAPQAIGTWHVIARAGSASATAEVIVLTPVDHPEIAVRVDPPTARLEPGASLRFAGTALAAATGAVTWSVREGLGGGSIDASGTYVAPPAPGAYHVVATSVDDPSRSASAAITVSLPEVRVAIAPLAITVAPGARLQFSAAVSGAQDARVAWSSDCGDVAADGSINAPAQEGTWHVIAHSVADASVMSAAVVVVDGSARAVDPLAVTLPAGGRIGFASPGGGFSVTEGATGGSVTPAGQYQAPRDHGGTFHVTAGGSSATVTVVPPDLVDHGGPVTAATRTFAVWWGDPAAWAADVRDTVEGMLRGLDGSDYLALTGQYLRGSAPASRFGGSFIDLSKPPASSGEADSDTVGGEACNALRAGGVVPVPGDVVFIFGAAGLSPAPSWCAWHSTTVCGGATLMVAFVPNVAGSFSCLALGAPLGCTRATADANATASLSAHELLETMTDPFGSAWTDADGEELGDKCEADLRCVPLGSSVFQLQAEYSNAAHACAP